MSEWNPTMRTPDGEPIEPEQQSGKIPEYRKEAVLREHVENGLTVSDIADQYRVGRNTIGFHLRRFGIEPPRPEYKSERFERTRELHEDANDRWGTHQYAKGGLADRDVIADGGNDIGEAIAWALDLYECPDCGREHPTVKGQHDCMRRHSQKLAIRLAKKSEVLP